MTSIATGEFFARRLAIEVGATLRSHNNELLYVASVWAHFAQTGQGDGQDIGPSGHLRQDILDPFVLVELDSVGSLGLQDPEILHTAGSTSLFLLGLFWKGLEQKHGEAGTRFYQNLGQSFFLHASKAEGVSTEGRKLFMGVATRFPWWVIGSRRMFRTLKIDRYLIRNDASSLTALEAEQTNNPLRLD